MQTIQTKRTPLEIAQSIYARKGGREILAEDGFDFEGGEE